ncbi:WYL domain-containing protein [Bacillus sp. NPDC077027]|uniref:WYL domain-containing protein n=1 Tax=Bacillus sp. NPDC077027 TaxID=3390548 RepID=UPI003D06BEE3
MNQLLEKSLHQHMPTEMIYMKTNGDCSKRKVIVHKHQEDYIQAYCLLKKKIRTFRKDRILALSPIRIMNQRTNAVS